MNVLKENQVGEVVPVSQADLIHINGLARKEMTAEEVYTFAVRLCDNQVDRDGECFPRATLEELSKLFVGKSGLFDHSWSAKGQAARIYRTEIVEEGGSLTPGGEVPAYLKGYAYMVRTEGTADLIAEIEGGIKKEVSVGCSVARSVCSICGGEGGRCEHRKGMYYDGNLCFVKLLSATDAYEFSFVAVPAQPLAGVMKGAKPQTLKAVCEGNPVLGQALEALESEALLGRRYLRSLREDVVRLGGLASPQMDGAVLRSLTEKMAEGELLEMRRVYEEQASKSYPIGTQFSYGDGVCVPQAESAFLI